MKAIDLYSGVGGWTLGLKMAGIETIASYDQWDRANETLDKNFGTKTPITDIRELDLDELPSGIDIVVGSPPCTQFSFSNRGGSGDLQEGLKDVTRFLEIVEKLEPRYWAMENVPRVKNALEWELTPGGALGRFSDLVSVLTVVDCSEYGLPQRRCRAIIGNFPIDLFESYRWIVTPPTLGNVLAALRSDPVIDPNYLIQISKDKLTDEDYEVPLNDEELRINRAAKQYHTVYNKMAFPDRTDTVSRTITATCTRVSRESLILKTGGGNFRRLSIRERAVLQGFPVTYQFYGNSYSDRVRMIGNAMPPLLAYFIGCSMLNRPSHSSDPIKDAAYVHHIPKQAHIKIQPERHGKKYSRNRMFRFTIPNLRFGSGLRFQLSNNVGPNPSIWKVRYLYGTPKNILEIELSEYLLETCISQLGRGLPFILREKGESVLNTTDGKSLQSVWIHKTSGIGPFDILDLLGDLASEIRGLALIMKRDSLNDFVFTQHSKLGNGTLINGLGQKYKDNADWIFAGFIIGSWFNTRFST